MSFFELDIKEYLLPSLCKWLYDYFIHFSTYLCTINITDDEKDLSHQDKTRCMLEESIYISSDGSMICTWVRFNHADRVYSDYFTTEIRTYCLKTNTRINNIQTSGVPWLYSSQRPYMIGFMTERILSLIDVRTGMVEKRWKFKQELLQGSFYESVSCMNLREWNEIDEKVTDAYFICVFIARKFVMKTYRLSSTEFVLLSSCSFQIPCFPFLFQNENSMYLYPPNKETQYILQRNPQTDKIISKHPIFYQDRTNLNTLRMRPNVLWYKKPDKSTLMNKVTLIVHQVVM